MVFKATFRCSNIHFSLFLKKSFFENGWFLFRRQFHIFSKFPHQQRLNCKQNFSSKQKTKRNLSFVGKRKILFRTIPFDSFFIIQKCHSVARQFRQTLTRQIKHFCSRSLEEEDLLNTDKTTRIPLLFLHNISLLCFGKKLDFCQLIFIDWFFCQRLIRWILKRIFSSKNRKIQTTTKN